MEQISLFLVTMSVCLAKHRSYSVFTYNGLTGLSLEGLSLTGGQIRLVQTPGVDTWITGLVYCSKRVVR